MGSQFSKDPAATLDYQVDWSAWLGTDTIDTSTWTLPTALTKTSESHTPTVATIWVSGGVNGKIYYLTNHITTAGGRIDERTITIIMENK